MNGIFILLCRPFYFGLSLNAYTFFHGQFQATSWFYLLIQMQFASDMNRNCIKQNQQKPNHYNQHLKHSIFVMMLVSRTNDFRFLGNFNHNQVAFFPKLAATWLLFFEFYSLQFLVHQTTSFFSRFLSLYQDSLLKCDNDFVIKSHKLMIPKIEINQRV